MEKVSDFSMLVGYKIYVIKFVKLDLVNMKGLLIIDI